MELKSPTIPLEIGHLTQLMGYIADAEAWIKRKFSHDVRVTGYLIGTREKPEKRTRDAITLENQIAKAGPTTEWKVFDLRELLRNTEGAHADMIKAIENDLGEDHVLIIPKSPASAGSAAPAEIKEEPALATAVLIEDATASTTAATTEAASSGETV